MKSVYFGTDGFAAAILKALAAAGKAPDLVVSRPDSRQGRGRKLTAPPTAAAAVELGIDLIQPDSTAGSELAEAVAAVSPDVVSLCAYGALIREPLLSEHTILNLHPSLLPRWRGAAPIERALMAGDETTGVSIIRLVEELDAGPIALSGELRIGPESDFDTLSRELQELGADLLLEAIDRLSDGTLEFHDQGVEGVVYADRIEAGDRLLDPSRSAVDLERQVRALHPHIGARLELPSGEIIGVRRSTAVRDGPAVGVMLEDEGDLLVGCASGALRVTRLVPPGGREMDASAWFRGRASSV